MKEPVSEETKNIRRQKRKKVVKTFFRVLIILIVIAVAAFFVYKKFFTNKIVTNEVTYTYASATRRSIVEELTGSGTLQTAASYTLSARVGGEILSDTFDEGDTVKTDERVHN